MATGSQASSFLRNVPPAGSYVSDPTAFSRMTERNDLPMAPQAFPGFGSFVDWRINNVGILAKIELIFEGTITTTGATVGLVGTNKWPYGLLSNVQLSANGQNSLISVDGIDLQARMLRVNRNPVDTISSYPKSGAPFNVAGSAAVKLAWELPIAHSQRNLIGAIFAQSDESYLSLRVVTANQPAGASGDLFTVTAGNVQITGTFYPVLTFYEIPQVSDGKGASVVVLPDLTQLHGLAALNTPLLANGDTVQTLMRTGGALVCLYNRIDNGAATVNPHDSTKLTEYRLRYGGNQTPRDLTHAVGGYKQQRDYNGVISPDGAGANPYFVVDFEVDNPMRDVVMPKGVIDLQQVYSFAGVTWAAGAQAHAVMETLFTGA